MACYESILTAIGSKTIRLQSKKKNVIKQTASPVVLLEKYATQSFKCEFLLKTGI